MCMCKMSLLFIEILDNNFMISATGRKVGMTAHFFLIYFLVFVSNSQSTRILSEGTTPEELSSALLIESKETDEGDEEGLDFRNDDNSGRDAKTNYRALEGCPKFVAYTGGNVSTDLLVPGGKYLTSIGDLTDKTVYFCRALVDGNHVPGRFHADENKCEIEWNVTGFTFRENFDLLMRGDPNNSVLRWRRRSLVPPNVVEGGVTKDREPLYLIRCHFRSNRGKFAYLLGRYQPSVGPFTGYSLRQLRCGRYQPFEFLICS